MSKKKSFLDRAVPKMKGKALKPKTNFGFNRG